MKEIKDMNLAELANKLCDLHEGDTVGRLVIADRMDKIHDLTRWISVLEQMPEKGDHVLVYGIKRHNEPYPNDTKASVNVVSWNSTNRSYLAGACYYVDWYEEITHWKPLDKPEGV
jgi:hypothetical protein